MGEGGRAEGLVLLAHPGDALAHLGERQDLRDVAVAHRGQEQVEVLPQAPEPGARVEGQAHEDVPRGCGHVLLGQLRGVEAVGLREQRRVPLEGRVGRGVVLEDEAGGARGLAVAALEARGGHRLRVGQEVVVEPQPAGRVIRQVRQDVRGADCDASVRDVLGVDELDRVHRLALREEDRAGEAVEVGPGDETHEAVKHEARRETRRPYNGAWPTTTPSTTPAS